MAQIAHLPEAQAPSQAWQGDGACRTLPPDLFFHPEGERGASRRARSDRAKAICLTCPVLQMCRRHALTVREPYGIWGGLGEDERAAHYAVHPPQDPRIAV